MKSTATQTEFDRQLDRLKIREFRKNGDIGQLKALYDKYAHLVYGLSLNYLNDREAAVENVASIYKRFCETASRMEIENLKSWLYVATKDLCFEELKSKGLLDEQEMLQWTIDRNNSAAANHDGFTFLDGILKRNRLYMKAIEMLPGTEKSCIDWFYYKGKSMKGVADMMHIEEQDVRTMLRNAQKTILSQILKTN